MKSFAHFSILAIVLMSFLATNPFSRVESKPAPCISTSIDDVSLLPYTCDPLTLPTKKLTTKTTTKSTTTKKIKIINPHFSTDQISIR